MGENEFYSLFQDLVEAQQLDPKAAQWLLEKIMEILFPDPGDQKPGSG